MAADIVIVNKVSANDDISDIFTKSLPGRKHVKLRCCIMYSDNPNIYSEAS